MKELIEALLLPPGLFVLLGIISLALCSRWTGRVLFLVNLCAIYFLSIPVVGTYLVSSWEVASAVGNDDIGRFQPQAILVPMSNRSARAPEYGGGDTVDAVSLERLRYAAYLQRHTQLPILVAGGATEDPDSPLAEIGRKILEQEFQVPLAAVETAGDAGDDTARLGKSVLDRMNAQRILLVTHGWHMQRMSEQLRKQGLEVLEAPTGLNQPISNVGDLQYWIPQIWALNLSFHGLNERLVQLWYRVRSLYPDWFANLPGIGA